jgi:hypothetical protein
VSKPERIVEGWAVKYAKRLAYLTRKMNGLGNRSWPDQQFFTFGGVAFFMEFKREGEDPTPKQAECHKRLRALGHRVYVIRDKVEAKLVIDAEWARGRGVK